MERVLGVIPARGGSKGIPRKNIHLLGGKALIAYTIEAAAAAKRLTRTIVSTEDGEIAEVARACGGDVPFMRPAELATDDARAIPMMQHAVKAVEKLEGGAEYDVIVMLQPTTPFRMAQDIDGALELLERTGADSVISVALHIGQHPAKMKYLEGDRLIDPPFAEKSENTPRQKLPDVYRLNGAIYATRRKVLLAGSFKGKDSRAWVMSEERSVNIDTEWDVKLAQILLDEGLGRMT